MAIAADTYEEPTVRAPHDFARHPKHGAPYVAHPTETSKRNGNKADLIAQCAAAGIEVPAKVTVAQLHALLGPRPKRVMYGRPSSLGKQIENMTNLQKWSERAVALGVFLDRALLEELVALAPEQWNLEDDAARDLLDAIAVRAKSAAQAGLGAERGTHTHALTEDHDTERDWIERARTGEDLGLPTPTQTALVAAWEKMLATHDIEILATEAPCVDDEWRQAGTLDRICRLRKPLRFVTAQAEIVDLPAGWTGILDIKTGRLRLDPAGFVSYWHAYAVQLASYAHSVPYDPDNDVRGSWGFDIDQRWAVIAHLDVLAALDGAATCRLVLVDLEAGRHAGAMCVAAREWEARRDVFSLVTDDLAVSVAVEPVSVEVAHTSTDATGVVTAETATSAPVATIAEPDAPSGDRQATTGASDGAPVAGLTADDFRHLADEIGAWPDQARQRLARVWPTHLAKPKAVRDGDAVWTADDLPALQAAFTAIDAPWSIADHGHVEPAAQRDPLDIAPVLDNGGPLDQRALDSLLASIDDEATRATMNRWVVEAKIAGVAWHPRVVGTVRSFEQARVAKMLTGWVDDNLDDRDVYVGMILTEALGGYSGHHIGEAIGRMSIADTAAVIDVIDDIEAHRLTLQFADDGTPRLVAADVPATAAA